MIAPSRPRPKRDEAYNNRGLAHFKLGQNDNALKDYDEALRLNPKLTDAYFNRGNAHNAPKTVRPTRSRITTRSLSRMPKCRRRLSPPRPRLLMGSSQFENDRFRISIRRRSSIPKTRKFMPSAVSRYRRLGKNEQAVSDYSEAIKLESEKRRAL